MAPRIVAHLDPRVINVDRAARKKLIAQTCGLDVRLCRRSLGPTRATRGQPVGRLITGMSDLEDLTLRADFS